MLEDYSQHPQLSKIRIVLIETSHPGNIGAVARAMKNMGLNQLVLVSPKEFPSQVASARASSACDVLNQATVVGSLDEALVGTTLVVGASARLRKVAWPQLSVRETASLALQTALTGEVALVFGREDSGLSNAEMDKCHYLAHILTNPSYSSLNLSAAVQIFAYECLMAAPLELPDTNLNDVSAVDKSAKSVDLVASTRQGYRHDLASSDQLEGFYSHLHQALQDIKFLDPQKNARFMRRMRRIFNRTQLDVKELDILRGILTAAQRQASLATDSAKE